MVLIQPGSAAIDDSVHLVITSLGAHVAAWHSTSAGDVPGFVVLGAVPCLDGAVASTTDPQAVVVSTTDAVCALHIHSIGGVGLLVSSVHSNEADD